MSWYHPSSLFDKIFEGGIIIKGITGLLEFIGGLLLFFVPLSALHQFLVIVTQKELIEDPHDKIATFLLQSTDHLGGGNTAFLIIYLWIHATIKLVAVIGILRNQLWAYPFSLVSLGILLLYQLYHIVFISPSVGMIGLSIFDSAVLWLIWREYGKVKRLQSAAE